jgi:hypothetical protein
MSSNAFIEFLAMDASGQTAKIILPLSKIRHITEMHKKDSQEGWRFGDRETILLFLLDSKEECAILSRIDDTLWMSFIEAQKANIFEARRGQGYDISDLLDGKSAENANQLANILAALEPVAQIKNRLRRATRDNRLVLMDE